MGMERETSPPAVTPPSDTRPDVIPAKACTVYYDGSCPLCQREISLYQALDKQRLVRWHDVSRVGLDVPAQAARGEDILNTATAMARFHVRRADGTLVNGEAGFREVMKALPALRWLARLLSVPPLPWLASVSYDVFLLVRPLFKRLIPAPARPPRNDA